MSNRTNDLRDMIDSAQAGYDRYEPIFSSLVDNYLSVMDNTLVESLTKRNKSHIFFPKINAKVKRIVVSFQESYFQTDTFASVKPTFDKNIDKAEALNEAVDFYTTSKMKSLFETFTPSFYYAPILGTVVSRVYWDGEKPQIDSIMLKDIRFDPSARTTQDIRYYIHDIYLTVQDIKAFQRSGIYKKNVDADTLTEESQTDDNTIHTRIKLQEVYTQTKKGEWTVSTFHDRSTVLRQDVALQDGNPFVVGGLIPQIENPYEEDDIVRVYFDSIVSAIVPLQQEMNQKKNQQIDAIKRQLEPQIMIPTLSGLNPIDIERGARFLRIKNPTSLTVIPAPDPRVAGMTIESIDMDIAENIGVSAQQNGISSDTQKTATESSILSNEGNSRLQGYMRAFNETYFKPIFERVSQLVWKYGDDRFFAGVSRDVPFEFVAKINTGLGATNKEIQLAGIEKSYGMINGLFGMALQVQDVETAQRAMQASEKLIREALPLMGIEDVDEILGEEQDEQLDGQSEGTRPAGVNELSGMEGDINGAEQYEGNPLQQSPRLEQDIGAY